jgi:hypothetical protein
MAGPSSVPVFERFFRSVAQLKVDKNDVKRFREFVDEMVDSIAIAGRNSARWNDRDVIAPQDLPITKGLQERMREFGKLETAGDMRDWIGQTLRRPPADVTFGEETEDVLTEVFGGLGVGLARSFRIVDPEVRNPNTEHWERASALIGLLI